MSFESWLLFCVTETVLCFTPGPAVLLVASLSLSRGTRAGFSASSGILTANALYFVVSATGLGALLVASSEIFTAIKWAGAAYLVCLGSKALFGRRRDRDVASPSEAPPARRSFVHGLVTQSANPKALLFFTALLPQFLDPQGSVALQVVVLGASSIAIEIFALGCYALLAGRARKAARPIVAEHLERAGGALLIGAGAGLAALRRSPA